MLELQLRSVSIRSRTESDKYSVLHVLQFMMAIIVA